MLAARPPPQATSTGLRWGSGRGHCPCLVFLPCPDALVRDVLSNGRVPPERPSFLRYLWQELRALASVEATYRSRLYRAWQLGHWLRLMGDSRPYWLCRCGWEGKAARGGGLSLAAIRHLDTVVRQADGTDRPADR